MWALHTSNILTLVRTNVQVHTNLQLSHPSKLGWDSFIAFNTILIGTWNYLNKSCWKLTIYWNDAINPRLKVGQALLLHFLLIRTNLNNFMPTFQKPNKTWFSNPVTNKFQNINKIPCRVFNSLQKTPCVETHSWGNPKKPYYECKLKG
jgi:hypothetical protein